MGGGPVQHIVPLLRIVDHVRRPEAAEALVAQRDQLLLRPVHQILRLPVRQRPAAVPADVLPRMRVPAAHAVGEGQIRGKDMDGRPVADDGHVAHAVVAGIRPEDGPAAVQRLPGKAVPAEGKVHLLALRGGGLAEMNKQIVLHEMTSSDAGSSGAPRACHSFCAPDRLYGSAS